jgi:hypothetical protein
MGRFAGHNVVADLLAQPMLPLRIDWYVTVLDLGTWGALYTVGWDRQVFSIGDDAKVVKQTTNRKRIYPPQTGMRDEILAAAAPILQPRRNIARWRRSEGTCPGAAHMRRAPDRSWRKYGWRPSARQATWPSGRTKTSWRA